MLLYFHMDYPKSTLFIDNSSISYHELAFYEIARNHICETVIPFNTVQWLHKLRYGIEKGLNGPLGDSFGLCGYQKAKMDPFLSGHILQWLNWGLTGLNRSHFEWPPLSSTPNGIKWSHPQWLHPAKAKKYSVGLNQSHFECDAPPTWAKMDSFSMILSGLHPRVIKNFILMFVHMYILLTFTDMD